MRKIIILLAFLIPVHSLSAQESGVFLKLPMSPRGAAMGDAYTALADEPLGIFYNPAGIAFVKHPAVSFVHHIYLQQINGDSAGFVLPVGNFAIGLAPTIFKMKEEALYDSFGNDTGQSFGYQTTIAPLAIAGRFGGLAVGVAAKYYSEKIGDQSSQTTAYDAGAMYNFNKLRFGFSTQNLGGRIFDYDVVKIQRLGVAYAGNGFGVAADAVKEGAAGSYVNAGGEISVLDLVRVRAGWRLRADLGGPTFGFGFKLGNLILDYAFVRYGTLGDTHKMGLSYGFGTVGEKKTEKIEEAKPAEKPAVQSVLVKSTETVNIAVAEFTGKNVSPADASIVADFLRTALVGTGLFNVMDRNNMDTVLAEQKFQNSGCTERECAAEMGKLLSVRTMLVGSLSKLMDTYYITVNVVDVETGKITASYNSDAATSKKLKDACRKIAEKLSQN